MATFTDSFTFPSSSHTQISLQPPRPTVAPPLSVVSSHRSFPDFSGLKIQRSSKQLLVSSLNSRFAKVFRRGLSIDCEASETALDVPSVTDATWQSLVLKADDGPVMVEFWAPWCGPCRMIHPVICELSKHYAGKLKSYKLNTDESPRTATHYGIRSIPTIMIFVNGEKKDAVIGAVPKMTLTACIEKFL